MFAEGRVVTGVVYKQDCSEISGKKKKGAALALFLLKFRCILLAFGAHFGTFPLLISLFFFSFPGDIWRDRRAED